MMLSPTEPTGLIYLTSHHQLKAYKFREGLELQPTVLELLDLVLISLLTEYPTILLQKSLIHLEVMILENIPLSSVQVC